MKMMETPNRVLDNMFQMLEDKAMRAYAICENEEGKQEILSLLQTLSMYKLNLYKSLQEQGATKVLLKQDTEITDQIIAELDAEAEIITLKEDDDNTTSMEPGRELLDSKPNDVNGKRIQELPQKGQEQGTSGV